MKDLMCCGQAARFVNNGPRLQWHFCDVCKKEVVEKFPETKASYRGSPYQNTFHSGLGQIVYLRSHDWNNSTDYCANCQMTKHEALKQFSTHCLKK